MKLRKKKEALVSNLVFELLGVAAVAIVPWMAWLAHLFSAEHLDVRFGWMWGVLDMAEFFTLVLTTYYGFKRSGWVVVTAAMLGLLFLVDAWFDVLTSKTSAESETAIMFALFMELPLALLSFWIVYRVGKKYFH